MNPGVYILESLKNGRYYIGSSENHLERLQEHNSGKVAATKFLCPWIIKAFIKCDSMTTARRAELRLKRYKSRRILEKVINDSTFPWDHNRNKNRDG